MSLLVSQTVACCEGKLDCQAARQVLVKMESFYVLKNNLFCSIHSVNWRTCDIEGRIIGAQR